MTSQSAVDPRPVIESFETRAEADDYVQLRKKEIEEGCRLWKLEPTLEVEQ